MDGMYGLHDGDREFDCGMHDDYHEMHFDSTGVGISNHENSCGPTAAPPQARHRRGRHSIVPPLVTQLSNGSSTDNSEYEDERDEEVLEGVATTNVNGIKFLYQDETWTLEFCTYDPPVHEFLGRRGNMQFFEMFPLF